MSQLEDDVRTVVARLRPELDAVALSIAVEAFISYIDFVNDVWDALELDADRLAVACGLTALASRATVESGSIRPANGQPQSHLNA